MASERFDIQFWWEVQPGKDVEAVKAAMTKAFRLGADQADFLFTGDRRTVARGLDNAHAQQMKLAIEKAGGTCAVVPAGAKAPVPPTTAPPPPEAPPPGSPRPTPRPIRQTAPQKQAAGPSRLRLPLLLGVSALLVVAAAVAAYLVLRPQDPPRSRLLGVANQIVAGMQGWMSAIEAYPEFKEIEANRDRSGQPTPGITMHQFNTIFQDVTALRKGAPRTMSLGQALEQAGTREAAKAALRETEAALVELEQKEAKFSKPYQAILKKVRAFHEECSAFTRFALEPEREGGLGIYHIKYVALKKVSHRLFAALSSEIGALRSPKSTTEEGLWRGELSRSTELLESLEMR